MLEKSRKLLGVEFEEHKGGSHSTSVVIHQINYIEEVYVCFNKFKPPISSLPITKGTVFSKTQSPNTESEIKEMQMYPYRNLLGFFHF